MTDHDVSPSCRRRALTGLPVVCVRVYGGLTLGPRSFPAAERPVGASLTDSDFHFAHFAFALEDNNDQAM